MRQWLGHRDLCESQWHEPCSCPCSEPTCPGIYDCADPDCPVATWLKTQDT